MQILDMNDHSSMSFINFVITNLHEYHNNQIQEKQYQSSESLTDNQNS